MSDRYTRKDAEQAAKRLAEHLGKPWGHYTDDVNHPDRHPTPLHEGGKFYTIPGGWALDYNPTYGGCVIEELAPDGGTWITQPFGSERCSPREFVAKVNTAITALGIVESQS